MKLRNLIVPILCILTLLIGICVTSYLMKGDLVTSGMGSVPISTVNTNDYSVDVCINQDCDYSTGGQNAQVTIRQAAVAVLAAGGGVVNIRSGEYDLSSSINISLGGKSLIIKGDGHNTQLTNSMTDSSVDGSSFVITGSSDSSDDYFGIRDLYLIGGDTSGAGIVANNVYTVEVLNSKFYDFSASGAYGAAIKTTGVSKIFSTSNLFTSNTENILIDNATTVIYENNKTADAISIPLSVPSDGAAATSSGGSLDADTYYFKLTTLDGVGESLPSSELSCTVGAEMSATSSECDLTWTDVTGDWQTRVWMATTSGTYYGYYTATTSGAYYFATSTSLVGGTISTETTAYVNYIATSSVSWLMSGNVGIGTTSPDYKLDIGGDIRAEGYRSADGSDGWSGSCLAASTTVVEQGIITACN